MHTGFHQEYLSELSSSTMGVREVRGMPVEGFAGGRIKSKQPPCESTSSPAQNPEKNNALWLTRSFRLNMFRCTILVSFGITVMFYLKHNSKGWQWSW